MTHIENIQHILQYGITHSGSPNANPEYLPIGDKGLISTRNAFVLDNGNSLGEYIPFYFGVRMPMLYVVQKGFNGVETTSPEEIVYCVTTVQEIIEQNLDFVFTDGHAVNGLSKQYFRNDIQNMDTILDIDSINAINWIDKNDLDKKRRKEAEFLVLGDISRIALKSFIVYNQSAKTKLITIGIDATKIDIKPNFYF